VSHYRTTVDPAVKNSSHTLMLSLVGEDRDVLDVGCAAGDLARVLVAQGCRVSGIEYDPEDAEVARPHLQRLVVGDVTTLDLRETFGAESFDAIVFGDILEHLTDPARVLKAALPLLRPAGSVVISVPNVTHGSLRLALLQGRWRYTDTGLLDRTHLRFFTRESFLAMLRDAGLAVTDFRASVVDPLNCEVEIDDMAVPRGVVDWVRQQPDAMTYQFVVRAVLGDPDTTVPEMVPAVESPVVEDVHTERARLDGSWTDLLGQRDALMTEIIDLRRRVLTLRDHAIGAAAAVGTAQVGAEREANRANELRGRLDAAEADLTGARLEIAALRGSLSWRVGNALMRPLARMRRIVRGR